MKNYAITFPQLVGQAMEMKLGELDIARLRTGYDLAERMSDGLYRSQGCAFINHLVRTSSIVIAHGGSIDQALAAMLHSAYMLDCFVHSRRRGFMPKDRGYLSDTVGADVEGIIWEYHQLGWGDRETIAAHVDNCPSYNAATRSVLFARLANELEDYLDLAVQYRPSYAYRDRIAAFGVLYIELSGRIGVPELGQALKEAYDATLTRQIPAIAIREHINAYELPRRHFNERTIFGQLTVRAGRLLRKLTRAARRR